MFGHERRHGKTADHVPVLHAVFRFVLDRDRAADEVDVAPGQEDCLTQPEPHQAAQERGKPWRMTVVRALLRQADDVWNLCAT